MGRHKAVKDPETGRRVREERRRLGLTQEELAERANISKDSVYRVEHGDRGLSEYSAKQYESALGVYWKYFTNDSDYMSADFDALAKYVEKSQAEEQDDYKSSPSVAMLEHAGYKFLGEAEMKIEVKFVDHNGEESELPGGPVVVPISVLQYLPNIPGAGIKGVRFDVNPRANSVLLFQDPEGHQVTIEASRLKEAEKAAEAAFLDHLTK